MPFLVLQAGLAQGTSLVRRSSSSSAKRRWSSHRPNSGDTLLIRKAVSWRMQAGRDGNVKPGA